MLILSYFEYTTVVKKISEKETALNCGFGFEIENPIKSANLKQLH